MSVDSVNGQTGVVNLAAGDIPDAVSEAALADVDGAGLVGFQQSGVGAIPRTLLEKQQETISVRDFGVTGTGCTDDTCSIQAAIDASYGKTLFFPPGRYISGPLVIKKPIKIVGGLRQLTGASYFTNETTISFPGLASDEWALTIGNDSAPIIGLDISGISLSGNLAGNGLRITGTIGNAISDAAYRDILIYNFAVGIQQTYSICPLFENIRIQACTNGVQNNSQTNNAAFIRCSFATISNIALSHSNAEGIEYMSCNFANWTRASVPMTLFQSAVLMTSPYLEAITNPEFVLVGASGEVAGSKSSLVIVSPLKINNNVSVAAGAYVNIIGGMRGSCKVYAVGSTVPVKFARSSDEENLEVTSRRFVEKCAAGYIPNFVPYNGGVISYLPGRGFTKIGNANAAATSGASLSNTLVAGEIYTLKIAMREGSVPLTNSVRLRNGTALTGLAIDAAGTDAVVRVYPFKAAGANLYLQFSGEMEFFGYSIEQGNDLSFAEDRFCRAPSLNTPYVGESPGMPTDGTWSQGDRLYNKAPTAGGVIGWVCISGGSPGGWRGFGAIAT